MRAIAIVLTGLFAVILSYIAWEYLSTLNLRQDAKIIREQVLTQTPVGSDMKKVEEYCLRHTKPCSGSVESGFLKQELGEPMIVLGKKSIRGEFGNYRASLYTTGSISVFWGFDESDKLIDVWIWKTYDGP
jgi:hypothetical protein